ncbi:adhesion G-protein coupled receptor F3 [Simochromis diagramma]|uniref:adhesion G-protein coupled receptor F3 n=1 Tax=Simochromis diagramma TaxID=43689 RepID=UPI001A7E756E|nr:adhesion G-protein coupled receptor F3 [Simochromis diagramma]
MNVTGPRTISTSPSLQYVDFQVAVSVRVLTSKLQDIVNNLTSLLTATIFVDTLGMVAVEAPGTQVCYLSTPQLACKLEEATDSAGWNLTTGNQRLELNDGSVVQLNTTCSTNTFQSCIGVTLNKVTGTWEGTYECGFTIGSIRHIGRTNLSVALLPDTITLSSMPLTVDCSENQAPVSITVSAIIPASDTTYDISWGYNDNVSRDVKKTTSSSYVNYTFNPAILCKQTIEPYVNISFKNVIGQIKSAQLNIPVIYAGKPFCKEELLDEDTWPKTPAGDTVIIRTCPAGKVGYKSRPCNGPAWQAVFSSCVSEQLNKISNTAEAFLKGLGATTEVAKNIFEGLKNSSTLSSGSGESIADISASIGVLNMMADASNTIVLREDIFPDFVSAASNMLNGTWSGVNDTIRYKMSSNYLESVEGLVKNIKVNQSNGINSTNLDLTFCRSNDCNVSVFDIGVNMNKTNGILKTVAVKNLMSKLNNSFNGTQPERTDLILSATLDNNSDSTIQIRLDFPSGKTNPTQSHCVFWNTTRNQWSNEGCNISISDENHTICECNHLTAFSVLMSKGDGGKQDPILELISNIGLGVSICSLVIFLIIESLVWSAVVKTNLSHFRHTAIVNIATFLLLANCSFLASSNPKTLTDSWCLVLTICKHLFFLAMFCWMLCLSIMLVHQLIFVFSPLRKRVFMFLSSILGYVCPILMVGSSYVYYRYTDQKYYNSETCWLVYVKLLVGSMHAFLLPVGIIVLANLFSMVVVIVTLMKTSVPDSSKADDKETAKGILKVVIVLTPVFGVTWIVGFIQLIMSDSPIL